MFINKKNDKMNSERKWKHSAVSHIQENSANGILQNRKESSQINRKKRDKHWEREIDRQIVIHKCLHIQKNILPSSSSSKEIKGKKMPIEKKKLLKNNNKIISLIVTDSHPNQTQTKQTHITIDRKELNGNERNSFIVF